MKSDHAKGDLVYSTDVGRTCPGCRQAIARCLCARHTPAPVTDGVVRVSRETKGRGGKAVTVVKGLALDAAGLTALGKQLRAACGSGDVSLSRCFRKLLARH